VAPRIDTVRRASRRLFIALSSLSASDKYLDQQLNLRAASLSLSYLFDRIVGGGLSFSRGGKAQHDQEDKPSGVRLNHALTIPLYHLATAEDKYASERFEVVDRDLLKKYREKGPKKGQE